MSAEPHVFTILGATGDLAARKLLPALRHLAELKLVDERSVILGGGLDPLDDAQFREHCRQALDGEASEAFLARLFYQQTPDGDPAPLRPRIEVLEKEHGLPGNRVFYLALPPGAFPSAIQRLGAAGLNRSSGWSRLVIEKPFGHDLASARELNRLVHEYFDESQVFRIDHYLGKETVQNLLVFRFSNAVFEHLWNRDRIARVEITVAETLGVEHRAAYYERAGALRDMIQNHVTQLLTTTAMELPASFDAEAIRYEKAKVLRAIEPLSAEDAVFGQYTAGSIDGTAVPGYREEPGVAQDSRTETFVGLRLAISNWRWEGVPFYLRTGKRLPARLSQIAVVFRSAPVSLFRPHTAPTEPNSLILTLQPDEGFDLRFEVKRPGQEIRLDSHSLHFRYSEAYSPLPEAYETLLYDILIGDATLFVRADWVEASWEVYTPLLERPPEPKFYAAGTWGPRGTDWLPGSPSVIGKI